MNDNIRQVDRNQKCEIPIFPLNLGLNSRKSVFGLVVSVDSVDTSTSKAGRLHDK